MNAISHASPTLPAAGESVPDKSVLDQSVSSSAALTARSSNPGYVGNTIAGGILQASHRIGAVALLATLGVWVQMYRLGDFHWPLAVAAGASDLGFCLALLGRMFVRHDDKLRHEANGVAIFNLVFLVLAMYFIVFSRIPLIRANAAEFFTPTGFQPSERPSMWKAGP